MAHGHAPAIPKMIPVRAEARFIQFKPGRCEAIKTSFSTIFEWRHL
jgi:hypothetical protein